MVGKRGIAFTAGMVLLAAAAPAATLDDPNLTIAAHAGGFSAPIGMRFLGSSADDFFVIEKNTGLVKRVLGQTATPVLDLSVVNSAERGLLGIAIHPDFSVNGFVYLFYSATSAVADTNSDATWVGNRLSRFTWNGAALTNEMVVLNFAQDPAQGNGPNHNGGVIRFGPDGMLYGITGDLNRDRAEQNDQGQAAVSSQVGGLFRINDDGTAPGDNPFTGLANADFHRWYAYGIRNSFGFGFDPLNGNLWDTENGPGSYDEINKVNAAFNSGWNPIMGPDARDAQGPGDLVDLTGASTYSDPEFSWLSTVAPTSLLFLADTDLDYAYRDAVLVGDNNTGRVYLFRLNAARDAFEFAHADVASDLVADNAAEVASVVFGQDFGVTTDLLRGPDGAVYLVSLTQGQIHRIVPEPATLGLLALGGVITAAGLRARRRR